MPRLQVNIGCLLQWLVSETESHTDVQPGALDSLADLGDPRICLPLAPWNWGYGHALLHLTLMWVLDQTQVLY